MKNIINVITNNLEDICLRDDNDAGGHLSFGDILQDPTV